MNVREAVVVQLVWDMDGTLVDSTEVVPDAFVGAVAALGGPQVDHARVIAAYSLGVPEVMLAELLGRPLLDGEVEAYYQGLDGAQLHAYPGVIRAFKALRAVGHPVAVFTGAAVRGARTLLEAAGLDVDVLVGGDMVDRPKPAPDGLYLAAALLEVSAHDLVYIGDAPTDLQAARAAGALAAAASWGHLYDPQASADLTLNGPEDALALLSR